MGELKLWFLRLELIYQGFLWHLLTILICYYIGEGQGATCAGRSEMAELVVDGVVGQDILLVLQIGCSDRNATAVRRIESSTDILSFLRHYKILRKLIRVLLNHSNQVLIDSKH